MCPNHQQFSPRWGRATSGTWHLAYDLSPSVWVAACHSFTSPKGQAPITLLRSTLRIHPLEPVCRRCQKIASSVSTRR